jgi:hypothetical protein
MPNITRENITQISNHYHQRIKYPNILRHKFTNPGIEPNNKLQQYNRHHRMPTRHPKLSITRPL